MRWAEVSQSPLVASFPTNPLHSLGNWGNPPQTKSDHMYQIHPFWWLHLMVIPLYMIRAIFPSWTTSYHRFMVRPTCPNQDGNCGVLYERMARALVLCSGAVPNGTPEQQASSKQRRQTAPGWENNTFFACSFVRSFVRLFVCLFVCLVETDWRQFFFEGNLWLFWRCSLSLDPLIARHFRVIGLLF